MAAAESGLNWEELDAHLRVGIEAARAAGALIRESFDKLKEVEHKGKVDLVTSTDKACESLILSTIRASYPDHVFIGEEGTAAAEQQPELTDAPTWMCDPLDGTTNFVHRFPFSCVSIALTIAREPVVGIVYNPILEELYTAVKGGGTYLNGTRVQTSGTTDIGSALFSTEVGTIRDDETVGAVMGRFSSIFRATRSIRCCGAAAMNLAGVASGRLDGFYEVAFGGCWDVAAGSLLVTEAGGCVMDVTGKPFDIMSRRIVAAASAGLMSQSLKVLSACPLSSREVNL